jgi:hypothetical protein
VHSLPRITLAALAVLGLAACSGAPAEPGASAPATARAHGYVEGASEATEPQLHLATVNGAGEVALLDLLSEESSTVATLEGATAASTDGRFVFASTAEGLAVVDSGVWTVDHEDHSHYYRAQSRLVGAVEGTGPATVVGGTSRTAVWFAETGTGVVLDHDALGTGSIEQVASIEGDPHDGVIVPFGETLLATRADGTVRALDVEGEPFGATAQCADYSGTIGTRVGRVFGCADGALIATEAADGTIAFETVAYPAGTPDEQRATEFRGRPGRPTVAAVAGDTGAWLLDTRERTWTLLPTEVPLLLVAAADDRDGNVVALASDGRVLVLDPATGATVAATEPLLAATVADPALLAGVELTVDATRAYLNAPAEGAVYEIDYADGARIARTFEVAGSPLLLVETGR